MGVGLDSESGWDPDSELDSDSELGSLESACIEWGAILPKFRVFSRELKLLETTRPIGSGRSLPSALWNLQV